MVKSFFYALVTAFTIVGSVIGAGFISGKEIYEFFAFDFSAVGIYLSFVCFFIGSYLVMNIKKEDKLVGGSGIVVAIASIVITGCMISALDELFIRLFHLSQKIKIFSVLCGIFVFFISLKGISAVEKFNSIFIPVVAISVICLSISKTDYIEVNAIPKTGKGIVMPIIYCGFNLLLSFEVIKNSGEKLSPPFKLLSSLIFSLILCVCIFLIGNLLKLYKAQGQMPFVYIFSEDVKLSVFIDIITLFAIFSTLFSSMYTAVEFGGIKIKLRYKILIFLSSVALSEAGFSKIVEYGYPILGVVGFIMILLIYLLRAISRQGRPKRTFLRPMRRE